MSNETVSVEVSVLERYALRWSVLAAWADALRGRRISVPATVAKGIEEARIKLASGCFSSCEVGCVLGEVEAELMSTDGSSAQSTANLWVELLGLAMSEKVEAERLLRTPAVQFHYAQCGFGACKCKQ